MSYNETFVELLGALEGNNRAYVYELALNEKDAIKAISKFIPVGGCKVAVRNRVVYVKAPTFTHPNAQELSL